MEEKKLSLLEQRELLKEQYKAEMRADKARLDALRGQRLAQNAENLVDQMSNALEGEDSETWINKLNEESLPKEAKLAMALENFKRSEGLISDVKNIDSDEVLETKEKTIGEEVSLPEIPDEKAPTEENKPKPARTMGDDEA